MKNTILLLALLLCTASTIAQNKKEAEKLVAEGVAYNDKGHFTDAITKFDKALDLDKDNLAALIEKAITLYSLNYYDDAITYCQKAIEKHPNENKTKTAFIVYGSALDALKKPQKSIHIYDEGIHLFPDFFSLYFNKGITLSRIGDLSDALENFQKAAILNPKYASPHIAMANILYQQHKEIPAFLALCRFLTLDPQGKHTKGGLALLRKIIKGETEDNIENAFKELAGDPKEEVKNETEFSRIEKILTTPSINKQNLKPKETEVEQFIRKFQAVCGALKESKKKNSGFYWDYYVPYFIKMKERKLVTPFAYTIFSSTKEEYITNWLANHHTKTTKLYIWDKFYDWHINHN